MYSAFDNLCKRYPKLLGSEEGVINELCPDMFNLKGKFTQRDRECFVNNFDDEEKEACKLCWNFDAEEEAEKLKEQSSTLLNKLYEDVVVGTLKPQSMKIDDEDSHGGKVIVEFIFNK